MIRPMHKTLTTIGLRPLLTFHRPVSMIAFLAQNYNSHLITMAGVLSCQVTGRLDSFRHILPFALSISIYIYEIEVGHNYTPHQMSLKQEDFVYRYSGSFHN